MRTKAMFFALCLAAGSLMGVALAEAAKGPDKITIDTNKAKKAVKNFPHKAHVDALKGNCTECHHKTKKGETPKACHTCHKAKKDAKTGAVAFKKAYHGKCVTCHKKQKDKPKLKKCATCHKRK